MNSPTTARFRLTASKRLHRQLHTGTPESCLPALRQLLRHTAQPVSVITASVNSSASAFASERHNHGATLSSFSSVSFNPPLVAFSLRLPSRLANAFLDSQGTHYFTVHLLEAKQQHLAKLFARQSPPPPSPSHSSSTAPQFPPESFQELLQSALGSLDCQIAHALHLDDLPATQDVDKGHSEVKSCLFIARVLDVKVAQAHTGNPLVWYNQQYNGVG